MNPGRLHLFIVAILLGLALSGCGEKNPVFSFNPETVNNADVFRFQLTDARNVTATLNYRWQNRHHGSLVSYVTTESQGSATVFVFDSDSNRVYLSPLVAAGRRPCAEGREGFWTIKIVLENFSGTTNFMIEKR